MAQAKGLDGDAATGLLEASYEKYAEAVKLEPDNHSTWNDWGAAFMEQAKHAEGAAATRLFEVSYEKYVRALELKLNYQLPLFNLGCHAALQGKAADAVNYLNQLKQSPDKLLKKIRDESDFDRIRDDPLFKACIKTLKAAVGS